MPFALMLTTIIPCFPSEFEKNMSVHRGRRLVQSFKFRASKFYGSQMFGTHFDSITRDFATLLSNLRCFVSLRRLK